MKTIYAVRSNKTGKYLTNLFEDKHEKTFQAINFTKGKCYFYTTKRIAEDIAIKLNGHLVQFDETI